MNASADYLIYKIGQLTVEADLLRAELESMRQLLIEKDTLIETLRGSETSSDEDEEGK